MIQILETTDRISILAERIIKNDVLGVVSAVKHGADPSVISCNLTISDFDSKMDAYSLSAYLGHLDCFSALIKAKPHLFHQSIKMRALRKASSGGQLHVVKFILEYIQSRKCSVSSFCDNAIPSAIHKGHLNCVKAMLFQSDASMRYRHVHTAARFGQLECLDFLSNIYSPKVYGLKPLNETIIYGHTDCFKLLLERIPYDSWKIEALKYAVTFKRESEANFLFDKSDVQKVREDLLFNEDYEALSFLDAITMKRKFKSENNELFGRQQKTI